MRSLILFVLAVFMTACSSTKSKNFPAIKPVASIAKGAEVPLQQELEGTNPRKTVAGAIIDGDLWFYRYPNDCLLDWREKNYPQAVVLLMTTVMPEYGGAMLTDVFYQGLIRVFWGKDQKMHIEFLKPTEGQLRKLKKGI